MGLARYLLCQGHAASSIDLHAALLSEPQVRFPNNFETLAIQEEGLLRTRPKTLPSSAVPLFSLPPELPERAPWVLLVRMTSIGGAENAAYSSYPPIPGVLLTRSFHLTAQHCRLNNVGRM